MAEKLKILWYSILKIEFLLFFCLKTRRHHWSLLFQWESGFEESGRKSRTCTIHPVKEGKSNQLQQNKKQNGLQARKEGRKEREFFLWIWNGFAKGYKLITTKKKRNHEMCGESMIMWRNDCWRHGNGIRTKPQKKMLRSVNPKIKKQRWIVLRTNGNYSTGNLERRRKGNFISLLIKMRKKEEEGKENQQSAQNPESLWIK